MSQYSDFNYIRTIDIKSLYKLTLKAKEREEDKKLFQMYCHSLPYFDKAKSFEEWKTEAQKNNKPNVITMKSDDEIMREIKGVDF